MKKQDKELLVKDICSRLPYGSIEVNYDNEICDCVGYAHGKVILTKKFSSASFGVDVELVKPYLRPLSSMTDKEIEYEIKIRGSLSKCIDWFNQKKFDWRVLIEKNLAIEMTKDMYLKLTTMAMIGVDNNGNKRSPYKRLLRNETANKMTLADVTGNYEETKTIEDKFNECSKIENAKDWSVTTNTTDEPKYVKPVWHTGYVFIVEDRLVVANSIAKAIELYCDYMKRDERDIKDVRRVSNGKTCILDMSYDAIIEG